MYHSFIMQILYFKYIISLILCTTTNIYSGTVLEFQFSHDNISPHHAYRTDYMLVYINYHNILKFKLNAEIFRDKQDSVIIDHISLIFSKLEIDKFDYIKSECVKLLKRRYRLRVKNDKNRFLNLMLNIIDQHVNKEINIVDIESRYSISYDPHNAQHQWLTYMQTLQAIGYIDHKIRNTISISAALDTNTQDNNVHQTHVTHHDHASASSSNMLQTHQEPSNHSLQQNPFVLEMSENHLNSYDHWAYEPLHYIWHEGIIYLVVYAYYDVIYCI